ncbi:hypothetical protein D778_00091 [Xanthomarina gelatinilytica]|uniref:Uncharacterized protein n=1 Tax=Xanthomarina gelatinilytica TaxID=1137281 RepID=M7N022_9FLAO|nr:hypothetical protein D778_00091 [Xanthomarina gelatinilytica]
MKRKEIPFSFLLKCFVHISIKDFELNGFNVIMQLDSFKN